MRCVTRSWASAAAASSRCRSWAAARTSAAAAEAEAASSRASRASAAVRAAAFSALPFAAESSVFWACQHKNNRALRLIMMSDCVSQSGSFVNEASLWPTSHFVMSVKCTGGCVHVHPAIHQHLVETRQFGVGVLRCRANATHFELGELAAGTVQICLQGL